MLSASLHVCSGAITYYPVHESGECPFGTESAHARSVVYPKKNYSIDRWHAQMRSKQSGWLGPKQLSAVRFSQHLKKVKGTYANAVHILMRREQSAAKLNQDGKSQTVCQPYIHHSVSYNQTRDHVNSDIFYELFYQLRDRGFCIYQNPSRSWFISIWFKKSGSETSKGTFTGDQVD